MIRLYVTPALEAGALIGLDAAVQHYLFNVMRLKPGAEVALFNGKDGEWSALVESAGKRSGALLVGRRLRPQAATQTLELMAALIKRQRLEAVVEKAVELGVGRIRLITTRRTNTDHVNLDRLNTIAREAAEQTGRLDVPEILAPRPLAQALDLQAPESRVLFCDEAGEDPDLEWGGDVGRAPPLLAALMDARREPFALWAVLIGPEGGFDPEERAMLRARANVLAASLGPRILRADTAAFAALTLWQAALGDWRGPPSSEQALQERT